MWFITHFTDAGAPATGLSATIRIRRVDTGALVVTDAACTEIGDGGYAYNYTGFDPTLNYSIRFDGGATLADVERYKFGGNEVPTDGADSVRLDASGLQTDAAQEIRDEILADSTPFNGASVADILADTDAIDTRLPSDPADESLQQAAHTQTQADIAALENLSAQDVRDAMKLAPTAGVPGAGSVDEHLDTIETDTSTMEPIVSANLDASVSSRSDFDEATDPVELLDSGGTAGTSAAELVTDIEADLASNHGSGQWDGTDSDWTAGEREQIRYRLAMDGAQTDPTTGTGTLEDILADTDAIDTRLPSDPADESLQQAAHAQTQADVATRSSHSAADVDTVLTAAHGSGSWQGSGLALQAIVDAILQEAIASHVSAGNVAEALTKARFAGIAQEGKWEITDTGGGLLTLYEDDNTTVVAQFELYDADGERTRFPSVVVTRVRA